ncbi:helix-turn-helix domain-containing protein [Arenibaculum pallidiluteum]|uniref:helix-turn-helix domain-containing protein n=1 Tax=Arenibaculum pallidiluteum TaxID=2812559 RepID=UPI002E29C138|nr:helix-turn-helix transcriptional regulator [Arenibaculum pallidiluteum]
MSEAPSEAQAALGDLLRSWRQRRGLSQLDLACEAEVSTRHISFMETGRSVPSRPMLMRLAERLEVPLRERNRLLVAAGYAPVYRERRLDDPALQAARKAVDLVLAGHEPYPALAVDRHWTLVTANRAVAPLLAGTAAELLAPPVNVLRLSLHPAGLAPRIRNLRQWRDHVLARLSRQVDVSADPVLSALHDELATYPVPVSRVPPVRSAEDPSAEVVVPLRLQTEAGLLSLFSTTTVFGTAVDITLSELAIEAFFPADPETAAILRRLMES